MLQALPALKIFKFLSWLFGYIGKSLDEKAKVDFKIYDVTDWTANNSNTHIAQCLEKLTQSGIWSVNRIQREKYFFLKKPCRK